MNDTKEFEKSLGVMTPEQKAQLASTAMFLKENGYDNDRIKTELKRSASQFVRQPGM